MENISPFANLPEALVEEMLLKSEEIGLSLLSTFDNIRECKNEIRDKIRKMGLLKRDADFGYPHVPTTCGVDGSYAVEKMLATDLVACASVAIEGLTPPSEARFWEKPNHLVYIQPAKHDPNTTVMIRAIMMAMEMSLAAKAPHDIIFIDGSLTTPLIYFNQALAKLSECTSDVLKSKLTEYIRLFIDSYKTIIESARSDKIWVGIPKYTTRNELVNIIGLSSHYEDRAVLTSILIPDEFICPLQMKQPDQPWHLFIPSADKQLVRLRDGLIESIKELQVIYYRPHKWTPAFRIELSSSIASNNARIATLLQGVKYQTATPGIFEPYPLFMADRMVKHLGMAIPAFRQTATRCMAEMYQGDLGEIFFSMHGYRTESGW